MVLEYGKFVQLQNTFSYSDLLCVTRLNKINNIIEASSWLGARDAVVWCIIKVFRVCPKAFLIISSQS